MCEFCKCFVFSPHWSAILLGLCKSPHRSAILLGQWSLIVGYTILQVLKSVHEIASTSLNIIFLFRLIKFSQHFIVLKYKYDIKYFASLRKV